MASPTTRGKYKKQALGEGLNTWGLASGLNGLFDVMDEALHGVNEITLTGTAYTLTSTNYTTNDIRFRQFKFTGNFAATITIPATQNWWVIENQTGQTLTFDNGSNTATLQTGFFGLVVTNGTTVTSLTLPDGVSAKTVADNILSVNQVATDSASVIAVAGKSTEIGRLGTADAVADMAILGTADVVADMNTLATADVVADMNTLGTADVVADMNTLATADVVADMNTLATADVVADMNTLGTADVVADMNALATTDVLADMAALAETDVLADMALLGTSDVIADMALLATTDVIADMNTLGTADVVSDMNTLATADVVADMNTLGTADVVNDMNVLGTSQNVTNMNTLSGISSDITGVNAIASDVTAVNTDPLKSNINTTAGAVTNVNNVGNNIASVNNVSSNISSVNSFGNTYQISTNNPTTGGDGSSALADGMLAWVQSADKLRVYNATSGAWEDAGSAVNGLREIYQYVATANQTVFPATGTIAYDQTAGGAAISVYLNGVLLKTTDYTATNGTSITLASGAAVNDEVTIHTFGAFNVSDTYSRSAADARYLQISNNLSDVNSASTALSNLGGVSAGKSIALSMIFGG